MLWNILYHRSLESQMERWLASTSSLACGEGDDGLRIIRLAK